MTRLAGQPDPGCYGCQGTGFLRGFGTKPETVACSCVTHSPDCEPGSCAADCPEKRVWAECLTDGWMRCPTCRRIVDYARDPDPTVRRLWPHPPCPRGMVVKIGGVWIRPDPLLSI